METVVGHLPKKSVPQPPQFFIFLGESTPSIIFGGGCPQLAPQVGTSLDPMAQTVLQILWFEIKKSKKLPLNKIWEGWGQFFFGGEGDPNGQVCPGQIW